MCLCLFLALLLSGSRPSFQANPEFQAYAALSSPSFNQEIFVGWLHVVSTGSLVLRG